MHLVDLYTYSNPRVAVNETYYIVLMLEVTDPQIFSVFHNDPNSHTVLLKIRNIRMIGNYDNESNGAKY